MRLNFNTKLKIIRKVLKMKDFEMYISPWAEAAEVDGHICDNNMRVRHCTNPAKICLSRFHIHFEAREDYDHYHLCKECVRDFIGTEKEKEDYVFN